MTTISALPTPGQIARVRQRQYLVEEITHPLREGEFTRVRLSCVDDDAQGQSLEVLWEAELDAQLLGESNWRKIASTGFDQPKLFSAYLHTLRWNCVTATNPNLFQSPFRAGIKLDAYQVEPLRKALRLPRVNLFIADDVGLGKTIEAGLIARELLLRKKVRDIVVCAPPSILPQWADELEARFGMTFEVIDQEFMTRVRRERGYRTNPWTTHTRFLISHRLLIDETYTAPLRDWLGDFRPGSLLILDEAHHAAPASGSSYAIDSKITRAVRDLAPKFEHRLFLSATPHNGHSNSFSALLEILDPQRFCRGVAVKGKRLLDDVMVRRLKEDIREIQGGFPKRMVHQIDLEGLPPETPELRLSILLNEYRTSVETRLREDTKKRQATASLLISGLQQRLLSSIEAFARTLKVHRRTIERQQSEKAVVVRQPSLLDLLGGGLDADDERASSTIEDQQREEEGQFESASREIQSTKLPNRDLQLLDEMTKIAEEARVNPDARVRKLIEWIRQHLNTPSGGWNARRVIVFTEYEDTLRYLRQQLDLAFEGTERGADRIAIYHGPTSQLEREEIKTAFNQDPKRHPVRILLATDAAREGLNLQTHCSDLFHFDVPWNPARMEQRNGRIDRKLQPSPEAHCYYFVYRQRVEDRILQAIVRKTALIRQQLGSLSQVVEGKLTESLRKGIRHFDVEKLEREIEQTDLDGNQSQIVSEELEATRERQEALKEQIDLLRNRLEESKDWVGLTESHFRSAISCSLEMVGASGLEPLDAQQGSWQLPDLAQRQGADASWTSTLDTLRPPRKRDQKIWDWWRDCPIRPVVFDDPGTMTDEVVHLHLEHRLVQRLLGRFTAQGFVFNDLSRACLTQTKDAFPRIILIGRICLYGTGASRLHEELIPVTARWSEPTTRKGKLTPYAQDAEQRTMDLLEESLLKPIHQINEVVSQKLLAAAPRDLEELFPELQKRGRELAEGAIRKLQERAEKEALAMTTVLEDQRKRIAATQDKTRDAERTLFNDEEMQQLKADQRHWGRRLIDLEAELKTEPERIRNAYRVVAERVEPIGLAYLWPVTG